MMTYFYQSGTALSTLCWRGSVFPRRKSFQSENFHAIFGDRFPLLRRRQGEGRRPLRRNYIWVERHLIIRMEPAACRVNNGRSHENHQIFLVRSIGFASEKPAEKRQVTQH